MKTKHSNDPKELRQMVKALTTQVENLQVGNRELLAEVEKLSELKFHKEEDILLHATVLDDVRRNAKFATVAIGEFVDPDDHNVERIQVAVEDIYRETPDKYVEYSDEFREHIARMQADGLFVDQDDVNVPVLVRFILTATRGDDFVVTNPNILGGKKLKIPFTEIKARENTETKAVDSKSPAR